MYNFCCRHWHYFCKLSRYKEQWCHNRIKLILFISWVENRIYNLHSFKHMYTKVVLWLFKWLYIRLLECLSPLTLIWGHHFPDDQEHSLLLHSLKRLLCVWSIYILRWHTGRLTPVTLFTGASWEFGDERSMQMSSFRQSLPAVVSPV